MRLSTVAFAVAAGWAAFGQPAMAAEVYQVSTISALLAGGYDGVASLRRTLDHGNFGLGTLEGVDGELVVLDGVAWQARADGRLARVPGRTLTPFAVVTSFQPAQHVAVPAGLSLAGLEDLLDRQAVGWGGILAARVDGRFTHLTVRSEPKQAPPYRPLAEVIKTEQRTFEHDGAEGTLVAFRFPPEANGVNVPGWHLHFISRDRRVGGHVLGLETGAGKAGLEEISDLHVLFPGRAQGVAPAAPAAMGEQLRTVEGGGR